MIKMKRCISVVIALIMILYIKEPFILRTVMLLKNLRISSIESLRMASS